MKKKQKRSKNYNPNQTSFYFEDYLETNKKNQFSNKKNMFQDRIYLLFFLFFSLIFIFSIQITRISLNNVKIFKHESSDQNFFSLRRDIVDRNGILISRNISSFHVAINPKLVNNKKNLLIKLRLAFPELDIDDFKTINPSAENIAILIYNKLIPHFDDNYELKITLYETPRNFVEYSG